jgi:hypothetical protein
MILMPNNGVYRSMRHFLAPSVGVHEALFHRILEHYHILVTAKFCISGEGDGHASTKGTVFPLCPPSCDFILFIDLLILYCFECTVWSFEQINKQANNSCSKGKQKVQTNFQSRFSKNIRLYVIDSKYKVQAPGQHKTGILPLKNQLSPASPCLPVQKCPWYPSTLIF